MTCPAPAPPLRVASRGLNLRRGAGAGEPVTQVLEQRTLVVPGASSGDGRWLSVGVPELRLSGWVAQRYLEEIPGLHPGDPIWYALLAAREGEVEIAGRQHNDWVLRCHRLTTLGAGTDETPWCSAAMCWAMEGARLASTRSAAAASWRTWGVPLQRPRRGCVVVIPRASRTNPTAAHVALYAGERPGQILLLGGNQSNRVSVAPFPANVPAVYRWPAGV